MCGGLSPVPFGRDRSPVRLRNHDDGLVMHNVDFRAVTGPCGGAKGAERAENTSGCSCITQCGVPPEIYTFSQAAKFSSS